MKTIFVTLLFSILYLTSDAQINFLRLGAIYPTLNSDNDNVEITPKILGSFYAGLKLNMQPSSSSYDYSKKKTVTTYERLNYMIFLDYTNIKYKYKIADFSSSATLRRISPTLGVAINLQDPNKYSPFYISTALGYTPAFNIGYKEKSDLYSFSSKDAVKTFNHSAMFGLLVTLNSNKPNTSSTILGLMYTMGLNDVYNQDFSIDVDGQTYTPFDSWNGKVNYFSIYVLFPIKIY